MGNTLVAIPQGCGATLPQRAVTRFVRRPEQFKVIVAADINQDRLRLYNAQHGWITLHGIHIEETPGEVSQAAVKIMSAAGFAQATDQFGHSLRCMLQLGCCEPGAIKFRKLDSGEVWVMRSPS